MTSAGKTRRFVGRKTADSQLVTQRKARLVSQIPEEILNDKDLQKAMAILPKNYDFEIPKTVFNVRKQEAKRVALQMPEGLLIFACTIADIIEQFCPTVQDVVVMGDVTYGACCVDDYTAKALDCDMMVHYAHSCLIPLEVTKGIKILYIFVTIAVDRDHLINTLALNFDPGHTIVLVGTIQFNPTIQALKRELPQKAPGRTVIVPQAAPLSKGEILGCTSPRLTTGDDSKTVIVYVGDGRFHLESMMIHNPDIPAYSYDPYSRKFTQEGYDFQEMHSLRRSAISVARRAVTVGIIMGTLGRQGNNNTVKRIRELIESKGKKVVLILLSEIFPDKIALFDTVDAWVQVACPRLSIDWGYAFPRPLLSPYEATIAFGEEPEWSRVYPMTYYAAGGLGRLRS
ncbi:hypothetical protein CANCADRAFT_31086 [Tortispora caseinolytica NRRL Y-17796]|uniref:2-(3-amino-3-carboxypropyl)histidine synthase subunit 1 n=1 Tax=Tortispora caseinolytica NRRL Y-17796 TaxID=767744 RepID=A0A1E4TE55_9ASCO|nr:hypothetical protein CANCADRAFT_31086 [Tortispora caseinolytica NRRL Y-17796]